MRWDQFTIAVQRLQRLQADKAGYRAPLSQSMTNFVCSMGRSCTAAAAATASKARQEQQPDSRGAIPRGSSAEEPFAHNILLSIQERT